MDVALVRDDLLQEQMALDTIVSDLSEEQWSLPTPSPRWSIADQIGHLTYFDESATVAITNPDKFSSLLHELLETQDALIFEFYIFLKLGTIFYFYSKINYS